MSEAPSRALSYARLVRLPNVFTAIADIALGAIVVGPNLSYMWLAASSASLYSAGMVWNDVFDIEKDRIERPFRPLPSGQISVTGARALGTTLMMAGVAFAALAGWPSALVAGILCGLILLYDGWLKRTAFASIAMGACRFTNVLLGLSSASTAVADWGLHLHLAFIVGLYTVAITLFARTEAHTSRQSSLRWACVLGLAALILPLPLPLHLPPGSSSPLFPYLLTVFCCVVGFPAVRALADPSPARVQRAVKTAVLGIIALDAVLATAISGSSGLLILLLLPPAVLLGRWVYST